MKNSSYSEIKVPSNTVLFKEGQAVDFVYLIRSGSGVCLKENDGRLVKVGTISEYDFAGSSDSLKNKVYSETVISTSAVSMIKLPIKDISSVIDSCPEWIQFLLKTITSRLDHSLDLISDHRINDTTDGDFSTDEEVKYKKILKDNA